MQEHQEKIPNGQRGADSGGPAHYGLLAHAAPLGLSKPAAQPRDLEARGPEDFAHDPLQRLYRDAAPGRKLQRRRGPRNASPELELEEDLCWVADSTI